MMSPTSCVGAARALAGAVAGVVFVAVAASASPPDMIEASFEAAWLGSASGIGAVPVRTSRRAAVGSPIAVYFTATRTSPFDRTARVTTADEGIARVLDQGDLAAGSTLGCAIIDAVAPGRTVITIGGAPVDIEVVPRNAETGGPEDQPARILTPMDGAAAWGVIGVCASWWRGDPRGSSDAAAASPKLVVDGPSPSSAPLDPAWVSSPKEGPLALAAFRLDTSSLPSGPVTVRLVWPEAADDRGHAPLAERSTGGAAAIQLRIFHPESPDTGPASLLAGECEAKYDLPELPPERREGAPRIRKDAAASGGEFFDNSGASPHFRFPVEVSSESGAGWYQVVLTAAGDAACGVWPAVGVSIDESQYPVTRSAIAMGAFHRVPIGTPIRLEPGKRVLRLDFLNDFYVAGATDRNLRLDKIEVLRVADAAMALSAGAGGAESAMMSTGGAGAMAPMMSMQSASSGASGRVSKWPESAARADRARAVTLAFARPLNGAVVAGDLEVRGVLDWPGGGANQKDSPPPRTQLRLNDRPIADQIAASPRFVIPWESLLSGDNRIELTADDSGAASVVAVVRRPGISGLAAMPITPRPDTSRFIRLTVHDPRWDRPSRERIVGDQGGPERLCFALFGAGDLHVQLPTELQGDYEIDIEAKGQHFRGAPELTASLETDTQLPPVVLGTLAVPGGWDAHALLAGVPADKKRTAAVAHLSPGPKSVKLTFDNDLYEPDKGDRNVFVQAVVLRAVADGGAEPSIGGATIVYPAADQMLVADTADAVIFEPEGPVAQHAAEVLIDGVAIGAPVNLRGRTGPYLIPLSLRGVAPGSHLLEVRSTDARGRAVTSAGRPVTVLASDVNHAGSYQRAVSILNRLAFGPDERELIAVLTLGEAEYLEQRLGDDAESPRVRPAIALAAARYPNASNSGDVQRRAIFEALATRNPVRARFVLWAENHFSTWIRKTEPRRKADEHDRFTRLGIAPFGELLLASATSPAMLRYLDQEQSFARRLNENYAREIMELHTLGVHGGYSQQDVTALAKILTGWTTAREVFVASAGAGDAGMDDGVGPDEYGMRESFRFDPALGDAQARTFLGRTLETARPEDRHQRVHSAIAMLAAHPSTARFIAGKIAAHYVSFPPPDDVVADLTSTFDRTGGDIRAMLRTLIHDPRFQECCAAGRLAHPPDFAFRLARAVGSTDAQAVHDYLNLSGRGMFDRSTPDGYQENDSESMDSNAMLQRWKFAKRLEGPLLELIAPAARSGDKPIDDADAQRTIDLVAMRLTGQLLGEASNQAAMDLLRSTEGRRDERWRTVVVFIACTPEAQLK